MSQDKIVPKREPAKLSRPVGRPSSYTDELADVVLREYASGKSLRTIAKGEGMPDPGTVWRWREGRPEFAAALARARGLRAESLADEGVELVDACAPESGAVGKAREQANYRKWLASTLDRETYGDSLKLDAKLETAVVVVLADMAKPTVIDAGKADEADLPHVATPSSEPEA